MAAWQQIKKDARVQEQIELLSAGSVTREQVEDILASSFPFTTYNDPADRFDFTLGTSPDPDPLFVVNGAGRLTTQATKARPANVSFTFTNGTIPVAGGGSYVPPAAAPNSLIINAASSGRQQSFLWEAKFPDMLITTPTAATRMFRIQYSLAQNSPIQNWTFTQDHFHTNVIPAASNCRILGPTFPGSAPIGFPPNAVPLIINMGIQITQVVGGNACPIAFQASTGYITYSGYSSS